ncbi:hypothetical protein [Breoghania sp.]|uniref:DUF6916 family protein n=1 Tax=Breoghania sp. TaxID=2065378 RepID=UPI0026233381|nr:hypothetical protein [Breoghania sp.]
MTDLTTLELSAFTPLVGETFRVKVESGEMDLVLHEANALGMAVREGGAFSLIFLNSEEEQLAQQLFTLHHPALGDLQLLLVPLGPLGEAMAYEAVFT